MNALITAPGEVAIPQDQEPMPLTVADLIERLQRVDPELPVVLISDADMASRPTRKHLVAGVFVTLIEGEKEFEVLAITPADGVLYECFGRNRT